MYLYLLDHRKCRGELVPHPSKHNSDRTNSLDLFGPLDAFIYRHYSLISAPIPGQLRRYPLFSWSYRLLCSPVATLAPPPSTARLVSAWYCGSWYPRLSLGSHLFRQQFSPRFPRFSVPRSGQRHALSIPCLTAGFGSIIDSVFIPPLSMICRSTGRCVSVPLWPGYPQRNSAAGFGSFTTSSRLYPRLI